jgi:site-specific DNA-methyltransferase (adenine-specific)
MNLTDKIVITNEDNMLLMSRYPDNYFDLAIVDPPYGIGADKPSKKPTLVKQKNGQNLKVKNSNQYTQKNWDNQIPNKEYFDELKRISKNQIIWGANYFGLIGGCLVWDKLNGDCDQFDCELAYNSFNNRTDLVYFMWQGMFQGIYCGKDIRKALIQQGNKQLNEKRIHPTQKPILLYKWILDKYAKKGDKILDTHLGSGSIAIACHDYGFELTACELDKEYYEKAIERIKNHTKQLNLF